MYTFLASVLVTKKQQGPSGKSYAENTSNKIAAQINSIVEAFMDAMLCTQVPVPKKKTKHKAMRDKC